MTRMPAGYMAGMSETPITSNSQPSEPNPSPSGGQTAPAAEGDTAPTEQSGALGTDGGSASGEQPGQRDPGRISDDQLPRDLQPTDDNPLAKAPSEDGDQGLSLGADGPQG